MNELEELDIADVDLDDPNFEPLLVGRKIKVLLGDVDLVRWKQDLVEDRNRLATLCRLPPNRSTPHATPSWLHCATSSSRNAGSRSTPETAS